MTMYNTVRARSFFNVYGAAALVAALSASCVGQVPLADSNNPDSSLPLNACKPDCDRTWWIFGQRCIRDCPVCPDCFGDPEPDGCPPSGTGDGASVGADLNDPVDMFTGGFSFKQTDLSLPGVGMDLTFARTYRSKEGYDDQTFSFQFPVGVQNPIPPAALPKPRFAMGRNWDHNLNIFLTYTNDNLGGMYNFHDGTGRTIRFTPDGGGGSSGTSYGASYRIGRRLFTSSPGGAGSNPGPVKYETPDGHTYLFPQVTNADGYPNNAVGKVFSITDRNKNVQRFRYDADGDLISVTDTLGRVLTLAYTNPGPPISKKMLTSVTDYTGRSVTYTYYTGAANETGNFGDLKSVTINPPTGEGAPRTWSFEYAKGIYPHETNLTHIYNPRNELFLQNIYSTVTPADFPATDARLSENGRSYDAVVKQIRDDPATATQEVYEYRYLANRSSSQPPGNAFEFMATLSINRAGNVKALLYGGTGFLLRRYDFTGVTNRTALDGAIVNHVAGSVPWEGSGGLLAQISTHLAASKKRGTDDPAWFASEYLYDSSNAAGQVTTKLVSSSTSTAWKQSYTKDYSVSGKLANQQTIITGPNSFTVVESWKYESDASGGCSCAGGQPTLQMKWNSTSGPESSSHDPEAVPNYPEITKYIYDIVTNTDGTKRVVKKRALYGCRTTTWVAGDWDTLSAAIKSDRLAIERWEYDTDGRVTVHVPPGYTDDAGSPPESVSRRDEYYYYSKTDNDPGRRGRLQSVVRDVGGLNLMTVYDYDQFGNISQVTDPRGTITTYDHNAYGEVVLTQVLAGSPTQRVYARSEMYQDLLGNTVREDVEVIPDGGRLAGDPVGEITSTVRDYDLYGRLKRECREEKPYTLASGTSGQYSTASPVNLKSLSEFVTTEYEYDANDNLTLVRKGMAASGTSPAQPGNTVVREYDERNLLFKETRGPSTLAENTTRFDYNTDGMLAKRFDGFFNGTGVITHYAYDEAKRLRTVTDPLGRKQEINFDIAGRAAEWISRDAANTIIARSRTIYDRMGRAIRTDHFLDPAAPASPVISRLAYFPNSRVKSSKDELNNTTNYVYDRLDRLVSVTDPVGNVVAYIYDANGNALTTTSTEKSTLGGADQVFTTASTYDPLDRTKTITDGVGNATTYRYDSRGLLTAMFDAKNNDTKYEYDGLGRLVTTRRFMYAGGTPTGTPPGMEANPEITTTQAWDKSSRLIGQTDDNGNQTSYWYDEADRPIVTRMADGTFHRVGTGTVTWNGTFSSPPVFSNWASGYDRRGNPLRVIDANGNDITSTYNDLNLLTARAIIPGPGGGFPVVGADNNQTGTTAETYGYDALNRLTSATDNDTQITRTYDALSRLLSETLTVASWNTTSQAWIFTGSAARTVSYTYFDTGEVNTITYPAPGSRTVSHVYDNARRLSTITSNQGGTATPVTGFIAQYAYSGGRVLRRTHGNGTQIDYTWNGHTGTSGPAFRQVTGVESKLGSTAFDTRAIAWDIAQNKTGFTVSNAPNAINGTRTFTYDSAGRMAASNFATYSMDGVHNRIETDGDPRSGAQLGTYVMTHDPPEIDNPVNQYTTTPLDRAAYDLNGNLTTVEPQAGGGMLMALGIQPETNALHESVTEAIQQGGLWSDITGDGESTTEDFGLAINMIQQGEGGAGGCDPEEPTCGPLRLTTLRYDYRNQMVAYENTMGGDFGMVRLQYDALGRRVSRTRTPIIATDPDKVTAYVNGIQASWQVLAEYDGVGTTANLAATYVYGNYIDEPIQMSRDFDGAGTGTVQNFFYHQDDLFNVVALTAGDGSLNPGPGVVVPRDDVPLPLEVPLGAVVERVIYGDYGAPEFKTATGGRANLASVARNPYLFTGRDWDHEARLYHYRTRYMEPTWGRFTTRDSIGTWGDEDNLGNACSYVGDSPVVYVDAGGENRAKRIIDGFRAIREMYRIGRELNKARKLKDKLCKQALNAKDVACKPFGGKKEALACGVGDCETRRALRGMLKQCIQWRRMALNGDCYGTRKKTIEHQNTLKHFEDTLMPQCESLVSAGCKECDKSQETPVAE